VFIYAQLRFSHDILVFEIFLYHGKYIQMQNFNFTFFKNLSGLKIHCCDKSNISYQPRHSVPVLDFTEITLFATVSSFLNFFMN